MKNHPKGDKYGPGFILGMIVLLTLMQACQLKPERFELDLSDRTWTIWLDSTAIWEQDTLFMPPVDLEKIRINAPGRGWDHLNNSALQNTNLPATVEQYFWDHQSDTAWGAGDYSGVSWFTTSLDLPPQLEGKLLFLDFESVRLRAEVYVNQKLAGYDCIGNTPFRVEITDLLQFKKANQIAIRITDPGGNYYWEDYHLDSWGDQYIPPSHGFGGITGKVRLIATDKTYIEDVYIQNFPDISQIRIQTTIQNQSTTPLSGMLQYKVLEKGDGKQVAMIRYGPIQLNPGSNYLDTLVSIPDHKLWSPDHPYLYTLKTTWSGKNGDSDGLTKRFGLRWFETRNVDGNRSFFLNNKRIFLASAITWGFWPDNGIFPSPELAEKQVRNLKTLGLNMFNFHRAIGQSILFDQADELGMLVYEEPGGYRCPTEKIWFWKPEDDPSNSISIPEATLAWRWRREKLFRMIKRDRSHPSLIIYNMGNEMLMDPDLQHKKDMTDAHLLDPSRYITFSSHSFHPMFFPEYPQGDCPTDPAEAKLFMSPYDQRAKYQGWWDNHHALGEGTYRDRYYNDPSDYKLYSDNSAEIVFYGEEGAINAPARLDSIIPYLDRHSVSGWDSHYYRKTHQSITEFLRVKGFVEAGITLETLTTSFANNSYYYHGKMIENCRIGNVTDAYVINGLEDPKRSFYSGILDIYRNIKGNPALLSESMRPLYLAIKPLHKIIGPEDEIEVDVFIVNENILSGDYILEVILISASDTLENIKMDVRVTGGDRYGELLAEHLTFNLNREKTTGYLSLKASLIHDSKAVATGFEEVFRLPIHTPPPGLAVQYEGNRGSTYVYLESKGIEILPFSPSSKASGILIAMQAPNVKKMEKILSWVAAGNTLLILENSLPWATLLDEKGAISYKGVIRNDTEWSGGGFFNRPHPIFLELPSFGAMGWEYQDLVSDYRSRHLLLVEGETCIAGAYGGEQHQVGTAIGEVSYGNGTILISTLGLEQTLQKKNNASKMGESLLLNMLIYYAKQE